MVTNWRYTYEKEASDMRIMKQAVPIVAVTLIVLMLIVAGCTSNQTASPQSTTGSAAASVKVNRTAKASVTSQSLHAHRIVCIGDSVTQGGYGNETDRWPYWLEARLGGDWEVINKGEGGYKTADILANISSALALKPHFVIIMGGINDIVFGPVPLATTQANIKTMCKRVESSGAVPVLCTITPVGFNSTQRNTLNAWITKYAQSEGYDLIDFNKVLETTSKPGYSNTALMTADGIHPNTAGYIKMGEAINLTIFTGGS